MTVEEQVKLGGWTEIRSPKYTVRRLSRLRSGQNLWMMEGLYLISSFILSHGEI